MRIPHGRRTTTASLFVAAQIVKVPAISGSTTFGQESPKRLLPAPRMTRIRLGHRMAGTWCTSAGPTAMPKSVLLTPTARILIGSFKVLSPTPLRRGHHVDSSRAALHVAEQPYVGVWQRREITDTGRARSAATPARFARSRSPRTAADWPPAATTR